MLYRLTDTVYYINDIDAGYESLKLRHCKPRITSALVTSHTLTLAAWTHTAVLHREGCCVASFPGVWRAQALEMSVGKIPFLEAVNGSTVMLPCTYSSCIGIKNLYFNWQFNDNGTMQRVSFSTQCTAHRRRTGRGSFHSLCFL